MKYAEAASVGILLHLFLGWQYCKICLGVLNCWEHCFTDGDFCLVEDKTVPYEKIVQEIMAAPGARSVGLLAGVATHVALFTREAENHLKVFSKEELITAAASAAEVAAAAAELAGDLDA